MLVVAGFVWSMWRTLDAGNARAGQVAVITATGNSVRAAWLSTRAMALAAAEMQLRQTPGTVADAASQADRHSRRAQDALADIAAAPDTAVAVALQRVRTALTAYQDGVHRGATLRRSVLEERDSNLVVLQPRFDRAVSAARSGLAREDMLPNEQAEIAEHVRLFQVAIVAMRDAVDRFLVTGDATLQQRVTEADNAAESQLAFLMQARISTDMLELAEDMASAGRRLRDSAQRLFSGTATFRDHFALTADQTLAALEAALEAGVAEFTEMAATMGREQTEQESVARKNLLFMSAGIAFVLALSGWLTARAITRPMEAAADAARAIALGELAGEVRSMAAQTGRDNAEIDRRIAAMHVVAGQTVDALRCIADAIEQTRQAGALSRSLP